MIKDTVKLVKQRHGIQILTGWNIPHWMMLNPYQFSKEERTIGIFQYTKVEQKIHAWTEAYGFWDLIAMNTLCTDLVQLNTFRISSSENTVWKKLFTTFRNRRIFVWNPWNYGLPRTGNALFHKVAGFTKGEADTF